MSILKLKTKKLLIEVARPFWTALYYFQGLDIGSRGVPVKLFCAEQLVRHSVSFDIFGSRPGFCLGFRWRSLGFMLQFVVSAATANMILVRCNSNVPISKAYLTGVSNSPDHDIIGTTSLLQSSRQRYGNHHVSQGSAPHLSGRVCHQPKYDEE